MKKIQNKLRSKYSGVSIAALMSLLPQLAFAQAPTNFEGLVEKIYGILSSLVPIIISLSLIVFLWGVFQLVKSNNEDSRKNAIRIITFGIVALFIMVSVWGLVAILSNTFFGKGQTYIPQLK